MASPGAERGGSQRQGLEVGIVPASSGRDARLMTEEASGCAPIPPARASLSAPSRADGQAEEVAVCELCGLVSRLPRAPVCPACGGGYG